MNSTRTFWLSLPVTLFGLDVVTKIFRGALGFDNPTIILVLVVALLVGSFAIGSIRLKRSMAKAAPVRFSLLFFLVGLYGALVGLSKGNDIGQIVNDGSAFLIYCWLGVIFAIATSSLGQGDAPRALYQIVRVSIAIGCLELVFLMAWMLTGDPESSFLTRLMDNWQINHLPEYDQAFSINMIVLTPLLFLLLAFLPRVFNPAKKMILRVLVAIVLAAIYMSFVRVFWLGLMAGLALYALVFFRRRTTLALGAVCLATVVYVGSTADTADSSALGRLATVSDVADSSNAMKLLQTQFLLDAIIADPIVGRGFGMQLNTIVRNEAAPYSFEVDLLALMAKIGLVGFGMLGFMFVKIYRSGMKSLRYFRQNGRQFEARCAFACVFMMGFLLLADLTNPYFTAPIGV